jgi:hypothetical protein
MCVVCAMMTVSVSLTPVDDAKLSSLNQENPQEITVSQIEKAQQEQELELLALIGE